MTAMGQYIAAQTIKLLIKSAKAVKGSRVLVFGITFKENVSDIRNSRVIDIINELKGYGIEVIVVDPLADKKEVWEEYGVHLSVYNSNLKVDGIVIAVNHNVFKDVLTISALKKHLASTKGHGVIVDVKGLLEPQSLKGTMLHYWRL